MLLTSEFRVSLFDLVLASLSKAPRYAHRIPAFH